MIKGSVARRYAKALLSLGLENGEYEKYATELSRFTALLEHKELRNLLRNPSIPRSQQMLVIKELLARISPPVLVQNFLQLLTERQRLILLPDIAREYRVLADEAAGRIRGKVTSAQTLEPSQLTQLLQALNKRTGKTVELEQQTDPALIAGTVTQLGSLIYDGSLRTKLTQLKEQLLAVE